MILITGPGRSGTTFLVQLLTRCGLDTGYEPGLEPYIKGIRAGCEKRIEFDWEWSDEELHRVFGRLPHVVKGPEWSFVIKQLTWRGILDIEQVIMPIRDFTLSAKSRIDVGLFWHTLQTDDEEMMLNDQAMIMAIAAGCVVEACVLCDIPLTIMAFPRLVEDARYAFDKLERLNLEWSTFESAFGDLARPEQIRWR